MDDRFNLALGSLEETLNRVPFALTLSNLSAEDAPLIFMNSSFKDMTGCTDAQLGQNCRFLQAEFPNDEARAEVRLALRERRRTQVILRNRRMDGSAFRNFLLLEYIGSYRGFPELALGTQFVLSKDEEDDLNAVPVKDGPLAQAQSAALRVRLERRRIASDSAVRLLQSWCVLNELTQEP